jgi:ribosome-associated translation inhibitor RaiA
MNLILQPNNLRNTMITDRLVEDRLLKLATCQVIEEAVVRYREEPEASPRYSASVYLRIAGPDIHATACDHTLRVAVEKALAAVELQVADRQARRRFKRRSQLQQPATARTGRAW